MFLSKSFKRSTIYISSAKCSTATVYKYPSKEDEYTLVPQYPPIEKIGNAEKKHAQEWYNKIKRQKTVEEKLFEFNVPRNWGWKCFMVHEGDIPFNNLCFTQHVTRTHLVRTETLPHYYTGTVDKCTGFAKQIKNSVIDAIEYQLHIRREKLLENMDEASREKEMTKLVVTELNRIIVNSINSDEHHLKNIQTDFTPRMEASWSIQSLVETVVKKDNPEGIPLDELPEEYLERPSDKLIQYLGHPIIQLRHSNPLPKLVDRKDANIFRYSVPVYEYDPHLTLGYGMERRHLTNIPGFWPGDSREFSFLSYHFLNHINQRPASYGLADRDHAIHSQVVFASFGWLMALACYQGFSSYHDVTYPLVTQTVLTNGKEFVFGVYQLNTTEMYHENPYENPRSNICWVTPAMPLFEKYEDGKLKGFNDNTLSTLLQFYVNTPETLENCKMKPYLGENINYVADYDDDEKREWLENNFKHISANKPPRTDVMYEVEDWERIYKIKFAMRPRDARRRPFELREVTYQKKMSDWKGKYIPKNFRPDKKLPKWRQRKFAKTFYPE